MSYSYDTERPKLFTEAGVETLTAIRRTVERALATAGAIRAQEAWKNVTGDSWLMIAALDFMVEKKEIREVTGPDEITQYRVYVAGKS